MQQLLEELIDRGVIYEWYYNGEYHWSYTKIQSEVVLTKSEEKHWRPFKDCEELISAWEHKVFDPLTNVKYNDKTGFMCRPEIWVKSKEYGTENLITAFDNDNESIGGSCVYIQDIWVDMQELFDNFTFCDLSPCGCKE